MTIMVNVYTSMCVTVCYCSLQAIVTRGFPCQARCRRVGAVQPEGAPDPLAQTRPGRINSRLGVQQ